MNRQHVWVLLAIAALFASQSSMAQISAGGTPPSQLWAVASVVPTVTMIPQDHQALLTEDEAEGKDVPLRFAAEIPVNLSMRNSGVWETLPNGDRLWRLRIESPNALTLGFLYDNWYIPKGGELFIYNDDRSQQIGAFTGFNNWLDGTNITQPVKGSAVTLEYLEPVAIAGQSELSIMTVCHGYRDVFSRPENALDAYGSSGSCNNNVNCPEGANWQDEKRGVCMILSGGSRICTGSLVNNTAANETSYFLTAYHCLGGETSWVFMFNYESATCTNADGPTNQTVANATLRASWSTSDFALLQLSSAVPGTYNPYYNGWNRVDAASTNSICIHHPSGDIKKISFDNNAPSSSGWYTSGTNHWKILAWDDGTTEPGSSGSPLFDQNSRITGQLHGGDATCSNNVNDYFGKFATSWAGGGTSSTRLSDWLDPLGTAPNTLDGLNGTGGGGGPTPPANDQCPGTAITSLPYSGTGATTYATNNYTNCVGSASPEVIYSLTLTSCQNVTVSLCGSSYDTGLGIYTSGSCPGTTQVACNDDATQCGSGSTSSYATFTANANQTYWIRVHGYSTYTGNFSISVTGTACSGGGNPDVCPGVAFTSLPYSVTGSTQNAVNNYSDCVSASSREHIYAMTLTTCQSVTVSLCNSSYDTGLGVKTGGSCPGTTSVACNNNYCSTRSQVTFTANANQTYWISVHGGSSSRRGSYSMSVTGVACAEAPGGGDGGQYEADMIPPSSDEAVVTEFSLSQNYPNPFNPSTEIAFDLPNASHVSLKVYDVTGREVAVLADGLREAGHHTAFFSAVNLPSGVYMYRLDADGFSESRKMLLLK